MARIGTLPLSLLLVASSVACGTKDVTTNPNPNPVVTDAKLTAIALSVDNTSVAIGATLSVTAQGTYDDQSVIDLTDKVSWVVSDTTVLEAISGEAGKYNALIAGRATITAALEGVNGTLDVVVAAPSITALEIIPASGDLGDGATLVVTVIATYSDGSRETVTEDVTWSSSNDFILRASANDAGRLVTFGNYGMVDITAKLGTEEAVGSYNVGPPRVSYIQVQPNQVRIGDTPLQFTATGYWTNETTTDLTTTVNWVSSDPAIVSIDAVGLATRVTDGEVVITARATVGDVSGSVFLRTLGASVCGDYPTNHADGIGYDRVVAPMFWLDGYDVSGELVDFRMEDLPCQTETYQTVLFVVGAGWCPYCPDFKRRIDALQPQLNAAGMRVIYVETETDGGAPANNMQANSIINRTLSASTNPSIRLGDGDASGAVNQPFGRAVTYLPNALVVRTSDMQVIAAGQGHDFLRIAQNPEMSYGSN